MVRVHLLTPRSLSLAVKHPAYIRHCLQIRERHRFESCREYQFKSINRLMLHTVISTNRSGSNTLCKYLSRMLNAVNLLEPITDSRDSNGYANIERIIKDIIVRSKHTDIVAKFHIDHLLELYPTKMDVIIELLESSRRYYSIRENLSEQVKSVYAIEKTNVFDARFKTQHLTITSDRALHISSSLTLYVGAMGEWFKQFPGKLCVLEVMSPMYTKAGLEKYADVYTFDYDSENTKRFVEQNINLKYYFEQGNPLYSLVGA